MRRSWIALLSLLLTAPAHAAEGELVDLIEVAFGATNISATTGNGRLTAGISRDGDLTVLSWPSPSYFDHLHYMTLNGPGARARARMEAMESMGAFAGLSYRTATSTAVTFLRDASWTRRVTYEAVDNSVVVTRFSDEALGLSVDQVDFIPPDADVLVRRYLVTRDPGSSVEEASLLTYTNLSPNLSKLPEVPLADFAIDHKNDFLAVWDASRGEAVHFHPGDTGVVRSVLAATRVIERDFGPLGEAMTSTTPERADVDVLAADLDAAYAPGVYTAVTTLPPPAEYQIGTDATDTCAQVGEWADRILELAATLPPEKALPADPETVDLIRCGDFDPVETVRTEEGWQWRPAAAFEDLKDGVLEQSPLAGGQVDLALITPLTFEGDGAEATLLLAFGETHAEARDHLDAVAAEGADALQQRTAADHVKFADRILLPDDVSDGVRAFLIRTFLNMRVGTDAETGALVASISRQPPYQLDWPRDGAFFNAALDIGGFPELVEKRLDFYRSTIRTEEVLPTLLIDKPVPGWPRCPDCENYPPDSWEMNYYADGLVGGNVRLEIDNTALLVWSYAFHAGYVEDPAARQAYLERVWPTVKRAADFLAKWRDAETGLIWWANEDDNHAFTKGLQGAVTVFGALESAARIAKALGHEEPIDGWLARADELKAATMEHLYVDGVGFRLQPFDDARPAGPSNARAAAWIPWPARMLPFDDPRIVDHLEGDMDHLMPILRGEGPGVGYATKTAISAALALPDGATRSEAMEMVEILATEIANPDTQQLGEVFLNVDEDGDGVAELRRNAVSTPHLWAATLVYLTAMAHEAPEAFDRHLDVLPKVRPDGDAGCGCNASGGGRGAPAGLLLLVLLRKRRTIKGTRSSAPRPD